MNFAAHQPSRLGKILRFSRGRLVIGDRTVVASGDPIRDTSVANGVASKWNARLQVEGDVS
jgi:hypothetical protein